MRIRDGLHDAIRRRDIPKNAADDAVAFPGANEFDEEGLVEAVMEYLGDAVEVGDEHGLEDDAHVGGEEELDGDGLHVPGVLLADHLHLRRESLQVDQQQEDQDRPCQLSQVVPVLSSEGLHYRMPDIILGEQEVNQRDERALELHSELR